MTPMVRLPWTPNAICFSAWSHFRMERSTPIGWLRPVQLGSTEPSQPLADLFVDRGLMTDEQKTEVEKVVAHELEAHGGDPQATLAATMDGRSLEAIRDAADPRARSRPSLTFRRKPRAAMSCWGHCRRAKESRERYTLTHLHAKGGMGRVWLARDGALGRQIALKELRPDQADNSIVCSRFFTRPRSRLSSSIPESCRFMSWARGKRPTTRCGSCGAAP